MHFRPASGWGLAGFLLDAPKTGWDGKCIVIAGNKGLDGGEARP